MPPEIEPDNENNHGFHVDRHYPGLIRSLWNVGPLRVTRERKYHDRTNQKIKTEAWILSLPMETHRMGLKWERDCGKS
jgi:hypothetical protein